MFVSLELFSPTSIIVKSLDITMSFFFQWALWLWAAVAMRFVHKEAHTVVLLSCSQHTNQEAVPLHYHELDEGKARGREVFPESRSSAHFGKPSNWNVFLGFHCNIAIKIVCRGSHQDQKRAHNTALLWNHKIFPITTDHEGLLYWFFALTLWLNIMVCLLFFLTRWLCTSVQYVHTLSYHALPFNFSVSFSPQPNSLYNQGLKPLFYSEKDAHGRGVGWVHTGSYISYYRNSRWRLSHV